MAIPKIIDWYMYVLDANLLITSPTIPNEIKDSKTILYAETTIPGLSYSPVSAGGFGNRKVSFTIQVIKRDNIGGNSSLVQLFNVLRNPSATLAEVFSQSPQFRQNPKVLYNYGIGSAPLVWYVTKCDYSHLGQYTNAVGNPKFTNVDIELTLDETDFTNQMEKTFRQFASILGSTQAASSVVLSNLGVRAF